MEPFRDPTLPAEVRRWDHLEALADALSPCAPALVVLEDLHWSDPTAIWVLQHLPRAVDDLPIAFLATSRNHEPDMPRLDDLASRVPGDRPRGARRRRRASPCLGGGAQLDDAVDLHARTGGNPLFVQELVRSPSRRRVRLRRSWSPPACSPTLPHCWRRQGRWPTPA